MEEAMLVHECKSLKYLVHDVADARLRDVLLALLHHFVQVLFHELEHKEQLIILPNDLFQLHNIGMVKLSQALQAGHTTCQPNFLNQQQKRSVAYLNFPKLHTFFPSVKFLFHLLDCNLHVEMTITASWWE
jgi:hypothetical protein